MNGLYGYILGFLKTLLNPKISNLAIVNANCRVSSTAAIYRGAKLRGCNIGDYTYIANNTELENVTVGKFCSIADHCRIGMGTHNIHQISSSPIFTQCCNGTKTQWIGKNRNDSPLLKVNIGNDVWIGSRALVLGELRLGMELL